MTDTIHRPPGAVDVDALLDGLTLEEQVSLLAGADFWRTVAIPRVNVPSLKVSDGPAGVRGGGPLIGAMKTAAYPVGIALGSTWNVNLLREVGASLAREALDKGAGVLLAPTINVFRSALNGRNFENYAEDPVLTGRLAVAYVQGLQENGVAATPKHFAGNESEYQRGTISSDIPARAMRELYLRPFEMVVREADPWAIMTAYNRLDGTYCSEHPWLLETVLRKEWGFSGLVMSDWGGTHSAGESVRAGLDLEMPGPARARAGLLAEAQADPATAAAVKERARAVLRLIERTGTFANPRDVSDSAEKDTEYPETRALIRRAGAEGMVLLKNAGGVLPLPAGASVAVVGPNAAAAQVMGGGSAQMNAHRRVSPLDGLREAPGAGAVTTAVGCDNDKFLPVPQVPVHVEYRAHAGGDVAATDDRPQAEVMWFAYPEGVNPLDFHGTLTLTVHAPQDGAYDFSLASAGLSRLSVDGQELVDNWDAWRQGDTYFNFGSDEVRERTTLTAGPHTVTVTFQPHVIDNGIAGFNAVRIGFRAEPDEGSVAQAAAVAAAADYAVVCIGTNGDWETEGVDRWGLGLPGRQDELVAAVRAANPNTIVVLQTGGPVTMPWLDSVPAVLQAWFPGQEAGHAIADVLYGRAEPGGRLPQTFPASLKDDPTHPLNPDVQYPGVEGHVEYREGLYTGYRHVDRAGITPLFPFGFGLSYTTFELSSPALSAASVGAGESVTASVQVKNTGSRAGSTVVQLYVRDRESSLDRPAKELKAFAKVHLQPGQIQTVTLPVDMRDLAYYDDGQGAWVAEAGDFDLLIGQSSTDLPHTLRLSLSTDWKEPTA
ncbi:MULTISPECIES: glycoside hydrolase family 3 C-terminal domain-containing protein [Deinococcus]|uniref:Glycoside hydrolase family 3 C-terminal domain-containing protein n=1 Tax=Deinococcus rufus TaxID=2136097 RepID=A0ABV7ZF57_9DEIO|nr:glycoside hydrolase family 3 C-terminal domain-containing protein [Deinococcus sp. AB2017081]WQE96654.1 glycoside hydrolase family 3 C-terminal domain-containing protein [Deinococcus sp. AB2017081]